MDRLNALYRDAEREGIFVLTGPLKWEESLILQDRGNVAIVLDAGSIVTRTYERYLMAHEMGHYNTGTYYKLHSPLQLRAQAEWQADTWMVCDMVPIDDLRKAISEGYTETWDLADYFGVPEKVIRRADEIYHAKGLL